MKHSNSPFFLPPLGFPISCTSALLAVALALFLATAPRAAAGNTWDGGAGNGNWGDSANWNDNSAPSYGTLTFQGSTQTDNTNNSITAMNGLLWTNSSSAWNLASSGSTVLSLFDFGGAQAKIENKSSGTVSITADITFAANNGSPPNPFGEINAVTSSLSFLGGTLRVNGSSVNGIKLWGGGQTTTFDNTVSAAGKWFGLTANGVNMKIGGAFTSGDLYVMNNGTLDLKAGSTLTAPAIRLGGDFGNTGNQNQTQSGTLALSDPDGGYSLGVIVNSVSGNTSGSLLIDSQNTSGTTSLTGGLALDSDLRIQQAGGGSLSITTVGVEVKSRNLRLDGAGDINISSGISVTSRAGTLTVLGDGVKTLSGNNSADLKFVLNAGKLSVASIGNLGAPGTYFSDKLNFNGGTLKVTDNVTAATGFGVTISSAGGGIEVDAGKTLTFQEFILDGSASGQTLTKSGAGTLFFDKSGVNDLDGTTIKVAQGTFNITNTGLLPAALQLGDTASSGTFRYNNGDNAGTYSGGIAVNGGGGSIEVAQLGFTAQGVITGAGNFTKTGTGTLTLSGSSANTMSGTTTVSGGTLQLNKTAGVNAIAGAVTVNSGATLLLSASDQVDSGATDVVTLSGGTIKRASGVSEVFGDLNVTQASSIDFSGGTGGTITFTGLDYTPTDLLSLQLVNFTQGNTLVIQNTSNWTSLIGTAFTFSGSGGFGSSSFNGSTFTITAIPEPSTVVAALGLAGMMLWPARRRLLARFGRS